jgi:hypothetical protein
MLHSTRSKGKSTSVASTGLCALSDKCSPLIVPILFFALYLNLCALAFIYSRHAQPIGVVFEVQRAGDGGIVTPGGGVASASSSSSAQRGSNSENRPSSQDPYGSTGTGYPTRQASGDEMFQRIEEIQNDLLVYLEAAAKTGGVETDAAAAAAAGNVNTALTDAPAVTSRQHNLAGVNVFKADGDVLHAALRAAIKAAEAQTNDKGSRKIDREVYRDIWKLVLTLDDSQQRALHILLRSHVNGGSGAE